MNSVAKLELISSKRLREIPAAQSDVKLSQLQRRFGLFRHVLHDQSGES